MSASVPPVRALVALLVSGVCAAGSARPARADTSLAALTRRTHKVQRLLSQWRSDEAAAALGPLLRSDPDHPLVLAAKGRLLYRRGDYRAARVALKRAVASSRTARVALRGLLSRVLATEKTMASYVEHKSPGGHFVIRVAHGKDELLVRFAGETLEAMRGQLQRALGYAPPRPVVVEIYPEPATLARVSPLTEEDIRRSGTIALCKYDRLMIVTPRALLRGYGWLDTLAHEYVHLVVSRVSHNGVPIWLHEGLAKHFERRWRAPGAAAPTLSPTQQHLLSEALASRALLPWKRMHPSMAKLPDQRTAALAFAEVQTAVGFIAQRAGDAGVSKLLHWLRDHDDVWRGVAKLTGLPRGRFDRGWRRYLASLDLERHPGLDVAKLKFRQAEGGHSDRAARVRAEHARRFFRLADMLRRRKHTAAAIVEYRKARQAAGEHDETVANALARTYLEAGKPARAIAVLEPVLEYYPERAGPQTTLGTAYLRSGDKKKAASHLRVALRINPFDPAVHCGLARALGSSGRGRLHAKICSELRGR